MFINITREKILEFLVNYHVEGIINGIKGVLLNNFGQTRHIHFIDFPVEKINEEPLLKISNIDYNSIRLQAIPIIQNIIQARFIDSKIEPDINKSYFLIDWTIS